MRIPKTSIVLGLLVAVACLLPGCSNPDKNKLIFKPKVGEKRTVLLKQENAQTMKMAGMGMNQSMTSGTDATYLLSVDSIDPEGTATITVTYDDMKFSVPGMGAEGAAMPGMEAMGNPAEMMKKLQEAFKGQTFTMRVSRLGEVLAIEGADKVVEKVIGAIGDDSNPMMSMMKEMMKTFMSEQTIKMGMTTLFVKAPDKSLNTADTWNDSFTFEMAGIPTTTDIAYTLRGRNGGYVTIDGALTSKVDFANSSMLKMLGDMKMTGDLTGKGTGVYSIDEASGWLTRREDKTNTSGKISMDMPKQLQGMPNMPSNISMDMEMEITTEVTNTAQ